MSVLMALSVLLGGAFLVNLFDDDGSSGPTSSEPENEDDTINGSNGADRINGEDGDDLISGLQGADSLFGDDGDDTLRGGRGHDLVGGGYGDDQVFGDEGSDSIYGWYGDDTLVGGEGADTLGGPTFHSEHGNDSLIGGDGDDLLIGGVGFDTSDGGDGDDYIADYNLAHTNDAPNPSLMDGGEGDDTLSFDSGSTITGGSGMDEFNYYPEASDDDTTVITDFNPDEDTLNITFGVMPDDTLDLSMIDREDGDGVNLMNGDTVLAEILGATGLTLDDVSLRYTLSGGSYDFSGTDADERITVGYDDNTIDGAGGDDTIQALSDGENVLNGGAGDDVLTGSGLTINSNVSSDDGPAPIELILHSDTLNGGAGDDILISNGNTVMIGGEGADTFGVDADLYLSNGDDLPEGTAYPPNIITDFDPNEDVIVVDGYHVGGLTHDDPLSVVVWADGTGADIRYGDIIMAQVTGGQTLTPADIRVVEWLGALGQS